MSNNILLGITGSVAASKSENLYENLVKEHSIKVISTEGGSRYLTKEFMNKDCVLSSWDDVPGSPHIELARWADKFIIYPATANFLSKMAMGIADDLLLSTVLMYKKPIYISPAMHEEMYLNPIIQKNLNTLSENNIICGPRFGKLDIGDTGLGRMIEPNELIKILFNKKEKIVVTSGGTQEKIDSVRTISNSSSGKQGRAIGIELLARGYDVTFIHASNTQAIPHAKNVSFTTSENLHTILLDELKDASYLYMAAAVSDFIPDFNDTKLNRKDGPLNITLNPNIDIVKNVIESYPQLISIAFSAQLDDELSFQKLKDKHVNFLVINNVKENQIGSDYNKVSIINSEKLLVASDKVSKNQIASLIIDNTIT